MSPYFAVVDDRHDVTDPVTVVRLAEGAGPSAATRLNEDAAWVRTGLLDQIEAGEVPHELRPITAEAAGGIRERREQGIAFRYSVVVREDDPAEKPVGVLREWDASADGGSYSESFNRAGEWAHSTVRLDIERGSNDWARIVPSDAATVRRFIGSLRRK